jgi:hypothetical protein
MLNIPRMFSQLRHLQLRLLIPIGETDKILYLLVSLMRVVPLIEKLEVHVSNILAYSYGNIWFPSCSCHESLGNLFNILFKHFLPSAELYITMLIVSSPDQFFSDDNVHYFC